MAISVVLDAQTKAGGLLPLENLERLWLQGEQIGDDLPSSLWQSRSVITDIEDEFLAEIHNTMFTGDSAVEIDGVGQALPIPTDKCQLCVKITSDVAITLSNVRFYAYDGIVDTNPYRGLDFRAAQGGVSTVWIAANGASQALDLTDATGTDISYYIALSASPSSIGQKRGKLKCVFNYQS